MTLDTDPLAQLKDSQRVTAQHAFARMYDAVDPATRFLIADEVGLGKTMVARGVVSQVVDHLRARGTKRIDVVYICSNAEIARQNIARLRGAHGMNEAPLPDRITMLPLHSAHLSEQGLNFFSFTPSTSLDLKSSEGTQRERAMLVLMLRALWGGSAVLGTAAMRVFQGQVSRVDWFARTVKGLSSDMKGGISPSLLQAFGAHIEAADDAAVVEGRPALRERYEVLREEFRHAGDRTYAQLQARRLFVGDVRRLLAKACVAELQPDLIILDEFQRFGSLLHGDDPASQLAHDLFGFVDDHTDLEARVLLLSATPYKMFTTHEEAGREGEAAEDHYSGFIQTVDFLLQGLRDSPSTFPDDLRRFRTALYEAATDGGAAARDARAQVEQLLRRVMCRTERLAVTDDRNGMLVTRVMDGLDLTRSDVEAYAAADRLARRVDVGDPVELWKSAPYLATFLDGYKFDRGLDDLIVTDAESPSVVADLLTSGIPVDDLRAYRAIDGGNARMRALMHDVLDGGLWRLLWMPPSLPYYEPGGAFAEVTPALPTKRLVFSSWNVVPRAIASMLSYEAERRIVQRAQPGLRNNQAARRQRVRLPFTMSGGRVTGMPVLALIYPFVVLAQVGDPLSRRRDAGESGSVPVAELRASVAEFIEAFLAADEVPNPSVEGEPPDERWYWAAPLLFDHLEDARSTHALLRSKRPWEGAGGQGDPGDRFGDHLQLARDILNTAGAGLGPRPADLVDVLTDLAIAAPAVCTLRALKSIAPELDLADPNLRAAAASAAWGLRALFNSFDTSELVRGEYMDDPHPYWRRVLRYCLDGNLQATLDEFAHVLPDLLGARASSPEEMVAEVAKTIREVSTLRTSFTGVRGLRANAKRTRLSEPSRERMRNHFAARLREDKSDDDAKATTRSAEVRQAFNSPFWPFVLASTSVGQEGLDFHVYCHSVVHWNLPYNPVDLEQREGRVHRFKGHAIRKNVAQLYGASVRHGEASDPWEDMFDAGVAARPQGASDLVPYWVQAAPGGAAIERTVLAQTLSREVGRSSELSRALAVYRLAFGQPRQEDLLAYLEQVMSEEQLRALAADLRIDLSPPSTPS